MFKILILQRSYRISDAQTEFQIRDRLSLMRLFGLNLCYTVPDKKKIWLFRERLVRADIIDTLFYRFTRQLGAAGLITRTGSIVDDSVVDVPRHRNIHEENETIKKWETPED